MKSKKYGVPILLVVFALLVVSCGSANKEAATIVPNLYNHNQR